MYSEQSVAMAEVEEGLADCAKQQGLFDDAEKHYDKVRKKG